MSTSPIKKHTTILVITILFCGIGSIGLWRFATLMQAKKNRVMTIKEQLASYDQNKKIFVEESAALAAISTRVTALESYFVTTATTPEVLSNLEALGQKNGIEFTITSVQTPGAGEATQKLLIDFSAKGGASQMDAFFKALAHQSYQVVFTRFSFFADGPGRSLAVETDTAPLAVSTQWAALASIEIISF